MHKIKISFKIIIVIITIQLLLYNSSYGGLNSLTINSRANCGNNESITWHAGNIYRLKTITQHNKYNNRGSIISSHIIELPWQDTWRSAAVCWSEGTGGWYVWGWHYMQVQNQIKWLGLTETDNCSIYDGWWN